MPASGLGTSSRQPRLDTLLQINDRTAEKMATDRGGGFHLCLLGTLDLVAVAILAELDHLLF